MKSFWVVSPAGGSGVPDPIGDIPTGRSATVQLVEDLLLPSPSGAQVLLSVRACVLSRIPRRLAKATGFPDVRYALGHEVSGVVLETGPDVKRVRKGQEVVGILPTDTSSPGCATHLLISEMFLVHKPEALLHSDCVSLLRPGLQAYTALYLMGRLQKDDVILVCDGASPAALLCIQLAHTHCSKIIATVSSGEEAELLRYTIPFPVTVIDLGAQAKTASYVCLKETGGLGANLIIDFGIRMDESLVQHIKNSEYIENNNKYTPGILDEEYSFGFKEDCYALSLFKKKIGLTKSQILSCLSLGGRWVTSQDNLQLDPPDTHALFMKGASLSFLFPDLWGLSGFNQGKYLHIVSNLMAKLETSSITPSKYSTIGFEAITDEILNYFSTDSSSGLLISIIDAK